MDDSDDGHGAVSVKSPLQEAAVGPEQALALILLPHEQDGSHSDH